MPNVYDQFDTETQANPYDQFDEQENLDPQALAAENLLKAERPYYGTGQQPFSPLTGSFLGPTATPEEKAQFSKAVVGAPLEIPGAAIRAGEKYLINPAFEWMGKHAPTVVNVPPEQERETPEERALRAMEAQIAGEAPPPDAPPQKPISMVTPESVGFTPDQPAIPAPGPGEFGPGASIQRALSGMSTEAGVTTLPLFEFAPVRGLYAAAAGSAIPESISQLVKAKTGPERAGAATDIGIEALTSGLLFRSLKEKGVPNAIQQKGEPVLPGMRPRYEGEQARPEVPTEGGGPAAGERGREEGLGKEAPVPLTADEADYLDQERGAIDAGLEVGGEHLPEGQPFAANEVATINRDTGKIVINPSEFKAALADLPPERRQPYVRSLLAEEQNHLATTPEDAEAYAKAMTGVERALETRAYTGKWTRAGAQAAHGIPITDRTLGYESVRRRMQQLARMSPTEVAQAVGTERWKMEGINVLQRMISRTMETLPTDRSNLRRAILEKVQGNLDAARFVAAGGNPSSLSRPKDQLDEYLKMEPMAFLSQFGTGKPALTGTAYRMAEKFGPDEVDVLESAHEAATKELRAFKSEKLTDFNKGMALAMRKQFFNEAAKWRSAMNEAAMSGASTVEDYAKLETKHGVQNLPAGEALKKAVEQEEAPRQEAKGLEPQSGRELTGMESMVQRVEGPSSLRRSKTSSQRQWEPAEGWGPKGTDQKWFDSSGDLHEAGQGHMAFAEEQLQDVTPPNQSRPGLLYEEMYKRGWVRAVMEKESNTLWIGTEAEIADISPKVRKSAIDWGIENGVKVKIDTGLPGRQPTLYEPRQPDQPDLPMSLRRPKPPKEHPELFLPPVKGAAEVERGGFRQPAAGEITQMTDQFWGNVKASGKLPSFEEFSNTLRAQFGSQVPRDSIWYSWADSLTKHLMNATGEELTGMMHDLGLKRDIAEAVKPDIRDPFIGKIPDKLDEQMLKSEVQKLFKGRRQVTQQEFQGFLKNNKWITRGPLAPGQKVRLAVIGGILDKLTQRAGEAPDKSWDRSEIGPEDIAQGYSVTEPMERGGELEQAAPQIETRRLITRIPAESAGDARLVGELATADAAVDATGKKAPPRTVSKNVMALLDRDGKVTLVSAWKDPRTGPKITNPTAPSLPGEKITANLLKSWSPLVVMTLRDPVQKFHKVFDSVNDFEKWFGDVGIEGTPGIKTTSIQPMVKGKGAGPYMSVAPEITPLTGEVGEQPPPSAPSETARELTMRERRPPTEVAGAPRGTGPPPEVSPAPPHEVEMLSPEAQQALSEELAKGKSILGRMETYRTLAHRKVPEKKYTLESQMRYGAAALRERDPGSLRRAKQVTNDETIQLFRRLRALASRRTVRNDLPRIIDGQDRLADQYARQVGETLRLVSSKSAARVDRKEATRVREAAKAMLASTNRAQKYAKQLQLSGFTPNGLDFLRKDIASGRLKAENWMVRGDPAKRLAAIKWLKALDRLEQEVNYARDNWDNPELVRTAQQILDEGNQEIEFENAHGFDVTERAYYLPGRYEGQFWSDQQVVFSPLGGYKQILGEQYRGPKRFRDVYEAIANGPFIPASYDPAVLMESRVRAGRYRVAAAQAREMWKEIKDPVSKKPIATDPKQVPKEDPKTGQTHMEYYPPSLEYPHLIFPSEMKRGVPIAVSEPYVNMIKSLSETSQIGRFPGGKQALLMASMLKHGWLLIGDMFHYARLAQYGATLSGKRWWEINPDYKGGFAVLNWRRADLPEAVQKGYVTQEAADWANGTVRIRQADGTYADFYRSQVAQALLKNGLNASRVIDALYKDAVRNIPLIGEPWHKVIGPYNRWLFDKYTSGLMLQKAVENFERLHEKFPERDLQGLTRDVVRNMNMEFGNMGRQGIFRNPTFRDLAQIFLLAPMWREGIIGKEIMAYTRVARAGARLAMGDLRGAQYHMSTPVTRSMLRGVAAYFVLTQVLNLISRKQFTWDNNEKGHKMDAYIPTGKDSGFWLSPNSVFMEMSHDIVRLLGSRPRAHDALLQIGSNALGPVGKAAHVIATGEDEFGRRITTTPRIWGTAASELAPLPLSFGAPARMIGHAIAPNQISPPRRGAVQRQMMGWAGMKVTPADTKFVEAKRMADDFVEKNNLKPDPQFFVQATDEASYSGLRAAVDNDDVKEARKIFTKLRQQHPLEKDKKGNVIKDPIADAMVMWAQKPLTGSFENESMFMDSLNEKDFELFNAAVDQKQDLLNKYIDWYIMNSGEVTDGSRK